MAFDPKQYASLPTVTMRKLAKMKGHSFYGKMIQCTDGSCRACQLERSSSMPGLCPRNPDVHSVRRICDVFLHNGTMYRLV